MNKRTMREHVRKKNRDVFSATEITTMQLIGEGYTNAEIAAIMVCSVDTVKSRICRILILLDVESRAAIVHQAHLRGILGAPTEEQLRTENDRLKRSVAGLRNKNREQAHKLEELAERVLQQATDIERLRHANRELGKMATPWLENSQGQL